MTTMRKICIINQKGGVGKTTTTVNVAAGLSREGKRVLIIDLDAQGQIGTCLNSAKSKTLFDLLIENSEISDCIVHLGKNLDAIKSNETLAKAELILVGESARETVLRRKLAKLGGYDYVLLDCPPSLSLLNQNALLYADEAIVPSSTDVLGFDGLSKMMKTIEQINDVFDHNITVTKIVPTLHDVRNKICGKILSEMQNQFYEIVSEPIRVNSKLKEAPAAQKSIFSYDNASRGAEDYRKLVKAIIQDEAKFPAVAKEYTASAKAVSAVASE